MTISKKLGGRDDVAFNKGTEEYTYWLKKAISENSYEEVELRKKNNGWVSVEDAVPSCFRDVLILYGDTIRVGYSLFEDGTTTKMWCTYDSDVDNVLPETAITHWMPLPPYPEE